MLPIHVTAGLLALLAGTIALIATKGSSWHRRSGDAFVAAMLVMAATGGFMAALRPDRAVAMGGVFTIYLVSTAALTVKRSVEDVRTQLIELMFVGALVCIADTSFGLIALNSPDGRFDLLPAPPILMFAIISFFCVVGDARMLLGRRIVGASRLARHLWRMCFAMWIATASFFMGQPKAFPEPLRHMFGVRVIPVLLVIGVMLYWLARVAIRRQRAVSLPLRATQATR